MPAGSSFQILLTFQMGMLILDLAFNTTGIICFQRNTPLLTLYILQDTAIILSLILLVITFSSTFVFQAGLITVLLSRFAFSLILSIFYLALSIALHVYSLKLRWYSNDVHVWTVGLGALFVLHKLGAAMYYSTLKHTSLMLCDPRLRGDTKWLHNLVRNS